MNLRRIHGASGRGTLPLRNHRGRLDRDSRAPKSRFASDWAPTPTAMAVATNKFTRRPALKAWRMTASFVSSGRRSLNFPYPLSSSSQKGNRALSRMSFRSNIALGSVFPQTAVSITDSSSGWKPVGLQGWPNMTGPQTPARAFRDSQSLP